MNVLSDFGINPILLAAQVVNFLILLWILNKFLYGPIIKVLDQRKKKIEESLKNAEEIELKLQQAKEQADEIIAKASLEGQKLLDDVAKAGKQLEEQIMQKATERAEVLLKKNEEAMQLREERMINEVKSSAADLVTMALQKVTGKVINKEDQKRMIEKEVKNLS